MNSRFLQFQQMLFGILDLFLLNLLYLITQGLIEELPGEAAISSRSFYWMLLNLTWLIVAWLGNIYAHRELTTFHRFTRSALHAYFIWAFLVLLVSFLLRQYITLSRPFVFRVLLLFAGALALNRVLYLFIRDWVRHKVDLNRRVMILGYNRLGRRLAEYLESEEFNIRIVGFVDDPARIRELSHYPVFAGIASTMDIARRQGVTEIYSTIMPENDASVYQMMQAADQSLIRFRIVPDLAAFVNRPVEVDYLYDMPVLSVRREPLEEVANRFKKRMFDFVVSLLVTVFILSWLVPLLGLIIFIQSPGPIFFVQLRSGKNNKPFRCLKFRSMTVNKESNTKQATKNDARVTRIGRFMRKTSLDEFPQFLNVLMGQMSIVGPRPHMLKHTEDYAALEVQYMIRQFLKPGITGWAQVNGYRGEISELVHIQKRVEYDVWYLEHWSLSLDLKIMFLTVYNVFKGEENAY